MSPAIVDVLVDVVRAVIEDLGLAVVGPGGGAYSDGIRAAAGGSCAHTQQPATRTNGKHSHTLTGEVAGALTTREGETGACRENFPEAVQPDRALNRQWR